ncbi:transporter substrate-binding domain-containing protein [Candidatus Methylacidiphilum infernorum]|uniref:Transporter substrate-binding domain-containing protein n=1 Tax=Candidatus Methylacidiphilum infernorum TaxID=511746 RepID=A0ABX7PT78_9BACT|nr:transporter substrate-binding domain-containing protein [Candidatus Methylacidiphilum infernorum]QSR86175.1 transporter substrate-binding domain-containing protein [Candidatus Methylacidiphilum infernorum]
MKSIFFIPLLLFSFFPLSFAAEVSHSLKTHLKLRVATRNDPPFSFKGVDGEWEGIAVDLWRRITADLNIPFEFVELPAEQDVLINNLLNRKVDVVVTGIGVETNLVKRVAFSYPFLTSGLGVAYKSSPVSSLQAVFRFMLSSEFLAVVCGMGFLTFIAGLGVWIFERKKNPHFGGSFIHGIGNSFWWAAVTMTTIGYGDKVPRTVGGRTVAMIWMFVGVVLLSFFTAWITAGVALEKVNLDILKLKDLSQIRVATVRDSLGSYYLKKRHIRAILFNNLEEALEAVKERKADAVLDEIEEMRYLIQKNFGGELEVSDKTFARIDYAFAFRQGDDLQREVDAWIIAHINELKSYVSLH